jgi:uncharacterized protein (TIGR03435 family)
MIRSLAALSVAALAASLHAPTLAQATAGRQEAPPILEASFEVASLRRNIDGGPTRFNPQATGQFTVTNFQLETLILAAYQLQSYQLQGAPSWSRDERYNIEARLDPKIAGRLQPDGHPPTWALALRSLLAERTGLTFHRETRELPIYALTIARADRKLGPNLQPAKADCDALRTESEVAAREKRPSPYPPATDTWTPCGLRLAPGRIVSGGFGFAEFLAALSRQVGRQVVDRTGLAGKWDFFMTYAPDDSPEREAPHLFTALQEQLGLKLESATGPVNVFVIDRLEHPAEQ